MNNITRNNYKSAPIHQGQGATELLYSDRHAYTVSWVDPNCRRGFVQRDLANRVDGLGMSDMQDYAYVPQPDSENIPIKFYPSDGHWHIFLGNCKGNVIMLGRRDEYYDYSF